LPDDPRRPSSMAVSSASARADSSCGSGCDASADSDRTVAALPPCPRR
jgi:hypothetical protein